MKSILATAAIVLATVGVVTAAQSAKTGADAGVSQALIAKENQWAAASKASNGDAIAPMLSEEFVALDSDGSMHSKAEIVARTKKSKWTTNEISDMKVMVYGDSAIVSGSWKGVGTDALPRGAALVGDACTRPIFAA